MAKIDLNLELLAAKCGVSVVEDEEGGWGGKYGHTKKGSCMKVYGYRTRKEALEGWFMREMDSDLGKELLKHFKIVAQEK